MINCFHSCDARDSLFRKAGVHPLVAMTPEDINVDAITPDITARSFRDLFGGDLKGPNSE
jgi:hypothetical protein